LFGNLLHGQEIRIKGKVTDSLQKPMFYANLMAETLNGEKKLSFAMTDENGNYQLLLLKKYAYKVTVSYMGCKPYVFNVDSLSNSFTKNIVLSAENQSLGEVIIVTDMAVKVTNDSIVYNTDKFKTGEERKLKDVLKKLPGVEVDKNGSITVMGKKVTKVLIENKAFFGGGTKLAVENIPADAIDKVTAINDYNSVGFMKGLTDSQKMVINIKLKKGKKRFVFGDIIAGGGFEEYYLAKANLFYYSPKTNLSFIGDANNSGDNPMTFNDFIRFESSDFMDMGKMESSFKNFGDLSQFVFANNFTKKTQKFSALQWQQDFGSKFSFSTYGIFANNNVSSRNYTKKTYLLGKELSTNEQLNNEQRRDNLYSMGKLNFSYKPKFFQHIDYSFLYKESELLTKGDLWSQINENNHYIEEQNNKKDFSIYQTLAVHYKLNKAHTFRLLLDDTYQEALPNFTWETNEPILSGIIPITPQSLYYIHQDNRIKKHALNTEFKHFWIVNNTNHIYTSVGNHYLSQFYKTVAYQDLDNGQENNFESSGFNNQLSLLLNDFFIGIQYKVKFGRTIIKPGVFVHQYLWDMHEAMQQKLIRKKIIALPELHIERKISSVNKIDLDYSLRSSLPEITKYFGQFYLTDFNSVSKGNSSLENELYHNINIKYQEFSLRKKRDIRISLNYERKIETLRNEVVYVGTDTHLEPIMQTTPHNNFRVNFYFKKRLRYWYYSFTPTLSYGDYQQKINHVWQETSSYNFIYKGELGSYNKKYPNVSLGISGRYSDNYTKTSLNNHIVYNPYLSINYGYKGFYLNLDMMHNISSSSGQKNTQYTNFDVNLFYQKDNSPFGFEISLKNIFDNSSIETFRYNDYFYYYKTSYQQGFTAMLKVNYKL